METPNIYPFRSETFKNKVSFHLYTNVFGNCPIPDLCSVVEHLLLAGDNISFQKVKVAQATVLFNIEFKRL